MKLLITICLFISTLLSTSTFPFPNSHSWGWSWKDLKIGSTTEEELLKNGGPPAEVRFLYQEYMKLKQGGKYDAVSFRYIDSDRIRKTSEIVGEKGGPYYPPNIPVLKTAPLQLSEEVTGIEFVAYFEKDRLNQYYYIFKFKESIDKKDINITKYLDIFSALLGRPVSVENIESFEYEGCYRVEFDLIDPFARRILLHCIRK